MAQLNSVCLCLNEAASLLGHWLIEACTVYGLYQLYFAKIVAVEQSEKYEREQTDIKIITHRLS